MNAALRMTLEDYLAAEADAPEKSEFANGEVIAMSGASPRHNAVKEALVSLLWAGLRGRACRSFSSDQRVHIPETGLFCYPDVVAVCGPPTFVPPAPPALTNPTAVFEVLSPSTESWDRGGKFAHVQRSAAVQVYALLDPERRRVEWYTRRGDDRWEYRSVTGEGAFEIEPLGVTLNTAELFADLDSLPPVE